MDPRTTDPRNLSILASRMETRRSLEPRPHVGNWLRRGDRLTRITYVWDLGERGLLIQDGGTAGGSFHLCETGGESYSGALDPSIPGITVHPTGETLPGYVWFFDHDFPGAGRGVAFEIPEPVWTA